MVRELIESESSTAFGVETVKRKLRMMRSLLVRAFLSRRTWLTAPLRKSMDPALIVKHIERKRVHVPSAGEAVEKAVQKGSAAV